MSYHCPYCGETDVRSMDPSYDWWDDDELICQWDMICAHCGASYIVSETLKVTDRIVAKDTDDLERQLELKDDS